MKKDITRKTNSCRSFWTNRNTLRTKEDARTNVWTMSTSVTVRRKWQKLQAHKRAIVRSHNQKEVHRNAFSNWEQRNSPYHQRRVWMTTFPSSTRNNRQPATKMWMGSKSLAKSPKTVSPECYGVLIGKGKRSVKWNCVTAKGPIWKEKICRDCALTNCVNICKKL